MFSFLLLLHSRTVVFEKYLICRLLSFYFFLYSTLDCALFEIAFIFLFLRVISIVKQLFKKALSHFMAI